MAKSKEKTGVKRKRSTAAEMQEYRDNLLNLTNDFKQYWPLTVRQIYYQAVSKGYIQNKQSEYQKVSKVLSELRRDEILSWKSIDDRNRITIEKRGIKDLGEYLKDIIELFKPQYYERCYMKKQKVYAEVLCEKDALSSIFIKSVQIYCTRFTPCRGQSSTTLVKKLADRFQDAVYRGMRPVILYFGDFDPSGMAIPKAIENNFRKHHNLEVEVIRCALNFEQIQEYNLPVSPDAAKPKDNNIKKWRELYGDQKPVELDALHPELLIQLVKESLNSVYDISEMIAEQGIETQERNELSTLGEQVSCLISEFMAQRGYA